MTEDIRAPRGAHGPAGPPRGAERRRQSSDPLLVASQYLAEASLHALFIIDNHDAVLLANMAARRLCADWESHFQIRRQRLHIQGKSAVEWIGPPVVPGRATAYLMRPPPTEGLRQEFRVVVSRTSLRRARDPIAITVYERHRPRNVARPLLQQLYDLTPSESATAAHLFCGLRPSQVAKELGVSVHTVRSHTKRVFTKCHVKSQSELVRLLALGPGVE